MKTACKLFFMYFVVAVPSLSYAQLELEPAFPNLKFIRPVYLEHPGDGGDLLFVVEQQGVIYSFHNTREVAETSVFLDIRDRVNDGGNEEGLLGLAFHPGFKTTVTSLSITQPQIREER